MPGPAKSLLALALLAAATLLVACGGEDAQLLPGSTAREITANLDTVEQLAGEGDCVGAEGAALQVGEQIEALEEIDPQLKQALRRGAARLNEVVARCEEEPEEEIDPAVIPPEEEEDDDEGQRRRGDDDDDDDRDENGDDDGRPGKGKGRSKDRATAPARPPATPQPDTGEAPAEGEDPSGGIAPSAPAGDAE